MVYYLMKQSKILITFMTLLQSLKLKTQISKNMTVTLRNIISNKLFYCDFICIKLYSLNFNLIIFIKIKLIYLKINFNIDKYFINLTKTNS